MCAGLSIIINHKTSSDTVEGDKFVVYTRSIAFDILIEVMCVCNVNTVCNMMIQFSFYDVYMCRTWLVGLIQRLLQKTIRLTLSFLN